MSIQSPSDPEPVRTLVARAEADLRSGRLPAAIAALSEAVAKAPALPDAWFNLAWAQRANRRFDDALRSYEQAILHGVARPEEARLNRAVIFSEYLFDTERAKLELQAALALDPGFVAAWLNLGNIHEDLGDVAEAETAYHQALAHDPGNGRAHARLGAIATFKGEAAAAIPRLHHAFERAGTIEARADILFALGAALDDTGEYDQAFQAFEAGNLHARGTAAGRYDRKHHEALVDRLIETFPVAEPTTPRAREQPAPIFICGMFRSGSTLAERLLSRHGAATPGGELEFIPALSRQLVPYPEAVPRLSEADRLRLSARYLAERPSGAAVTDKRCDNFLHIGLIFTLFPEAKIIHTVRHPVDTILSVYFQHFGDEIRYGHDLLDATHYYIQYRRLMAHWERLHGRRIHQLDYDLVVRDPRRPIEDALAFLGLPWEDRREAPASARDAVRTASVWQVRKPLHGRSSGRWRNYERHLGDVFAMLTAAGL